MNENESILAELRRIGAWAEMQRKIIKWSLIIMAVLIPAMIVFGIVMVKRETARIEDTLSPQKPEIQAHAKQIIRFKPEAALKLHMPNGTKPNGRC